MIHLFVRELSSVVPSSGSAHVHEQYPSLISCYLTHMPEPVSDFFGVANENKKKQQMQQKHQQQQQQQKRKQQCHP